MFLRRHALIVRCTGTENIQTYNYAYIYIYTRTHTQTPPHFSLTHTHAYTHMHNILLTHSYTVVHACKHTHSPPFQLSYAETFNMGNSYYIITHMLHPKYLLTNLTFTLRSLGERVHVNIELTRVFVCTPTRRTNTLRTYTYIHIYIDAHTISPTNKTHAYMHIYTQTRKNTHKRCQITRRQVTDADQVWTSVAMLSWLHS